MSTESLIESLLFYRASSVRVEEIAHMLGKKTEEIENALSALEAALAERGVRLVRADDTLALATAPEAAHYIEGLRKEEFSGELGKATLETLTLILYRAPISKSEIDYIRGVDSSFSIRALLVRGLVTRRRNEKGVRGFVYAPTIDTLSYLGVSRVEELPEFGIVREEIEKFRQEFQRDAEQTGDSAIEVQEENEKT
ncbi:MAG: SMC-Scp complex subunit ScpB [Parcubacteria group bacterium]|nr:SMC-Scp complex subunit ScpB [Parcubacteria group bacterium]